MSFSITLGNFLYRNVFFLYRPLYALFKNRQDAFEIALLKKHIKPGAVVMDIGANIGYYATILSKLVGPTGKVFCFEPDEKNFLHLTKTTAGKKNITALQKAVGPKTEIIKIYTSKEINVDHRTYEPEEYDKVIEIEAVSIDDLFPGITKVDLIKMDIQGFEMQAMKGMRRTLENNPDLVMISEFWPYGLSKAGSSVLEYFNHLVNLNFKIYLLTKNSLELLNQEKVKKLHGLGKEYYFNILVTRKSV